MYYEKNLYITVLYFFRFKGNNYFLRFDGMKGSTRNISINCCHCFCLNKDWTLNFIHVNHFLFQLCEILYPTKSYFPFQTCCYFLLKIRELSHYHAISLDAIYPSNEISIYETFPWLPLKNFPFVTKRSFHFFLF